MIRRSNAVLSYTVENVEEGLPTVSEHTDEKFPELNHEDSRQPSALVPRNVPESRPFSRSSSRTTFVSMGPFNRFKVEDLTNYAMNDQRWTLQRKKIGLKRRTSASKERKVRSKQTKDLTLNFIKKNFTRKECMKYQKDYRRSELIGATVCRCGNPFPKHEFHQPSYNGYGPNTPMFLKNEPESQLFEKKYFMKNMFDSRMLNGGPGSFAPLKRIDENAAVTSNSGRSTVLAVENKENTEISDDHDPDSGKSSDDENEEEDHILQILNADGITPSVRRRGRMNKSKNSKKNEADPSGAPVSKNSKLRWSVSNAMMEFPTNAYGTISFVNVMAGSNKPAKYIRLSDSTDLDSVIALLIDYWRLFDPHRPHLVLSVIGGAKNFRLDGKKKETFNSGLIRAVKSTNGWILTGGMQVGVTKSVGEAVKEGQFVMKVKRKTFFAEQEQEHMVRGIKCIGIAPWGYTKGNEQLVNRDLLEFSDVKYKVEDKTEKHKNLSLNGDHTHFLLIDDGIRNRYSGADKFRTKLQHLIQAPEPVGLGIPVVLLILEGGITCFYECDMALKSNIPVVVVANTGRAADLLAYAVSMTVQTPSGRFVLRKVHKKQLFARVVAAMPELEERQCHNCVDVINQCCENSQLITIFDINSNEGMDRYILFALLKGGAEESDSTKIDQLNLSLLWNRPDIAESHIFPSYPVWQSESLEDLMTTALLEEKVDFVRLFAMNGLVITEYLTVQRLRSLYNETYAPNTHLGRMLSVCSRGKYMHLVHVHYLLEALVKKHCDPVYMADTPDAFVEDPTINYLTFSDPYQELLLWAIMSNRSSLARYIWERCNSPLLAAITATCVYRSLWKSLGAKNTDMLDEYTKSKNFFEKLAVDYLEQCYKDDTSNAMGIVERRHAIWGELDCLQLAAAANDLRFISSPCCQASIEISWRRGMTRAPAYAVLIANVMPLLIFTRLFRFQKLGDNGGELTAFQKLIVFYKSPISKFYAHSTSFVLFLFLYAYVVLFEFRPQMAITEKLIVIWIFTNMLEDVNEMLSEDATRLGTKFSDWWNNVWNRFDAISFTLGLISFCLRLQSSTFKWGRVAYAVNTNILFIRLFRIYHASYNLGPKLVIFYRMISEVVVFMLLLLIFILGYGIASQSLLHPWRDFSNTNFSTVVQDVILTPYWQMYGELLLDKLEGEDQEYCPIKHENEALFCENPKDYTWVAYAMLVIYLIIGNIMLLNLLIAIFTYVFDEVQENSMEIWKFEMYILIREFDNKPGLVPPFIILEHVYRVAKFMWKKFLRKKRENLEDYMLETLKSLQIFEKEGMTNFLSKLKEKEEESVNFKVSKMAEKIDRITKYIDQQVELQELEEIMELADEADNTSMINIAPLMEEDPIQAQSASMPSPKVRKRNHFEKEDKADDDDDVSDEDEEKRDKLTEEISDDDIDTKMEHLQYANQTYQKVYTEGFSNLPFHIGSQPTSRPSSATMVSRPASGRSTRVAKARSAMRRQQNQITNLINRIDSIQTKFENSHRYLQMTINDLCSKLDKLNGGTRSTSAGAGKSEYLGISKSEKDAWKPDSNISKPAKPQTSATTLRKKSMAQIQLSTKSKSKLGPLRSKPDQLHATRGEKKQTSSSMSLDDSDENDEIEELLKTD